MPTLFRKIRGHIVPIHVNEEHAKAGGLIAGGAGVAHVTGKLSAALMHESANVEHAARQMKFAYTAQKNAGKLREALATGKTALRTAVKSKELERAAFALRHGGTVAAAALIGAGVHKALSQTSMKNDQTKKAAVASGAGVAATFLVRSSYLRGVGNRGFGVLKQAARRAFLKL